MPFSSVHPGLKRALDARGYLEPTPVQAAMLLPAHATRDLLVSAQTGSGKTVAFGLVAARLLLADAPRLAPAKKPLALVVAPTRELALQVHGELSWLYAEIGARIVSCVGGMDPRVEKRALHDGAHVVVGTPGRLTDHIERGQLDVSALRVVVLDEADEMLDLGFREELEHILDTTPADRRTLMFSATIPPDIAALAKRYTKDALRVALAKGEEPHADIEYRAVVVAPHERERAVVNVLRWFEAPAALVFCHTREAVSHLHANLLERGFAAVALSGEMAQPERLRALQSLRDGRARVCVATDVAARGLDLPELDLVIHADLPRNREILQHRSGRTGRAGRRGACVLLVPYTARRRAQRLLLDAHVDVELVAPPSAQKIRTKDAERLASQLAELVTKASPEDVEAGKKLLETHTPEQLAATLVLLRRELLPAPEEITLPPRETHHDRPAERVRDAHGPHADRGPRGGGDFVRFRMSVGREGGADPRWIVPFLCRRGHVTKAEIGRIDIRRRETVFGIAPDAAERFAAAASRPDDTQDGAISVELDR